MSASSEAPANRTRRGSPSDGIDVLVVDDSAVVRELAHAILGAEDGIRVRTAADPLIAMEMMARERPDVIVLDLEMPRMDGLTFLRRIMGEDPIPVVICSALSAGGAGLAFKALDAGAVEVVAKPKAQVGEFLRESSHSLLQAVKTASLAQVMPQGLPAGRAVPHRAEASSPAGAESRCAIDVVAIGASTGGPEALRRLLEAVPEDCPGIVIVQHMPADFTGALACHLDKVCRIRVREAQGGEVIEPGHALIACGDRHLNVVRQGRRYSVVVTEGPRVEGHRPSVDVLFRSVSTAVGARSLGVILTGMGSDGARGLSEMRAAGATTIAQDEKTSVVFGMAMRSIELGAAAQVLPLDQIAGTIPRVQYALPRVAPPG